MALPGIGALQDALVETNSQLAAVLRELQETNNQKLKQVVKELRSLNEKLDLLVARDRRRPAQPAAERRTPPPATLSERGEQ